MTAVVCWYLHLWKSPKIFADQELARKHLGRRFMHQENSVSCHPTEPTYVSTLNDAITHFPIANTSTIVREPGSQAELIAAGLHDYVQIVLNSSLLPFLLGTSAATIGIAGKKLLEKASEDFSTTWSRRSSRTKMLSKHTVRSHYGFWPYVTHFATSISTIWSTQGVPERPSTDPEREYRMKRLECVCQYSLLIPLLRPTIRASSG